MISIEKARDKLADYNVLLKYMSFLQTNGFSDCGRGQILGQIALLQEYFIEECGDIQKQDKGIVKIIDRQEKQMVADITYEAGRISISQENASNANKPKDLKQFIKVEYNERNGVKNNEEAPIQKVQGTAMQSLLTGITTEDKKIIATEEEENKLIKQSWRNRIKGMADVKDW
jgi:hypothetical protein